MATYMGARRLSRIVLPDFVPHILGYLTQIAVNLQLRLFTGLLGGFMHGLSSESTSIHSALRINILQPVIEPPDAETLVKRTRGPRYHSGHMLCNYIVMEIRSRCQRLTT